MKVSLIISFFSFSFQCSNAINYKDFNSILSYSFDDYLIDHHLKYENSNDYKFRKDLFEKEKDRIIKNNHPSNNWEEGFNRLNSYVMILKLIIRFSIMTNAEKRGLLGRFKSPVSDKNRNVPESLILKPVGDLPKSVDWRNEGKHNLFLFYQMIRSC